MVGKESHDYSKENYESLAASESSEIEGLSNQKYFHEWRKLFQEFSQRVLITPQKYRPVRVKLLEDSKESLIDLYIPKHLSSEAQANVVRYICTLIHNTLWFKGSYAVGIEIEQALFKKIKTSFETEYININRPSSVRSILLSYFGTSSYFLGNSLAAFNSLKADYLTRSKELPHHPIIPTKTGNLLVINIGITSTKIAIVNRQNSQSPNFVTIPREFPSTFPTDTPENVEVFLQQVVAEVKSTVLRANIDWNDVDGIVLGNSNFSPRGCISASDTGIFENLSGDNLRRGAQIVELLSQASGGKTVYTINDGDLQGLALAGLKRTGNFALFRFGTSLAATVIDRNGQPVPGINEIGRGVIDMRVNALPHPTLGTRGMARSIVSMRGIISVTEEMGITEKYGIENPKEIPTLLKNWLESDGNDLEAQSKRSDAIHILKEVGRGSAALALEVKEHYGISHIFLGASYFNTIAGQIIFEEMKAALANTEITVDIFAETAWELKFNGLLGAAFLKF